jgi:hypothetical protein
MAAAFAIVAFSEWLASRARWVAPAGGFVSSEYLEPAPYVEVPAWNGAAATPEPDEETEPEALTMVAVDPWEATDGDEADETDETDDVEDAAVADEEPESAEPAGQGFFRRRRR